MSHVPEVAALAKRLSKAIGSSPKVFRDGAAECLFGPPGLCRPSPAVVKQRRREFLETEKHRRQMRLEAAEMLASFPSAREAIQALNALIAATKAAKPETVFAYEHVATQLDDALDGCIAWLQKAKRQRADATKR